MGKVIMQLAGKQSDITRLFGGLDFAKVVQIKSKARGGKQVTKAIVEV